MPRRHNPPHPGEILEDTVLCKGGASPCCERSRGLSRSTAERLRDLSIDEPLRLVENLWDSIAADQEALPLKPAQRTELDRRLDTYELDKDAGRLASDVLADIRRRL